MTAIQYYSIIYLSICFQFRSFGQTTCTCAEQFQFFEEKISINYSGFRDKVTANNRAAYQEFTEQHRASAALSTSDTACYRIMNDWRKWFKDGHVQLQPAFGWMKPGEIKKLFAQTERIDKSEDQLKQYLGEPGRDAVEGIWRNAEGRYVAALTKQVNEHRTYVASILQADGIFWSPGQVKFELSPLTTSNQFIVRYYMQDHSLQTDSVILMQDSLLFKRLGTWYRGAPEPNKTGFPAPVGSKLYRFEKLDQTTALLVIKTMNPDYRKQLDRLMKKHKKDLKKTPNLIIDLRDNGGGSDITFRKVTPYLYTNVVKTHNAQIWATKDNADKYTKWQHDKSSPWYVRFYAGMLKRKVKRHEGEFIGKKKIYKTRQLFKRAFPKKVVVLMNDNCASSCENFIKIARQSKKVTLMGTNSAGINDFGDLHMIKFPCGRLAMRYPTTRYITVDLGKGIDGVGIPPDVRLGKEVADWVEYARLYLNKKD